MRVTEGVKSHRKKEETFLRLIQGEVVVPDYIKRLRTLSTN